MNQYRLVKPARHLEAQPVSFFGKAISNFEHPVLKQTDCRITPVCRQRQAWTDEKLN